MNDLIEWNRQALVDLVNELSVQFVKCGCGDDLARYSAIHRIARTLIPPVHTMELVKFLEGGMEMEDSRKKWFTVNGQTIEAGEASADVPFSTSPGSKPSKWIEVLDHIRFNMERGPDAKGLWFYFDTEEDAESFRSSITSLSSVSKRRGPAKGTRRPNTRLPYPWFVQTRKRQDGHRWKLGLWVRSRIDEGVP